MTATRGGFVARLTGHIPPGQFLRYLGVGLWNTAFGYGLFALVNALLAGRFPASYLAASLIASIVNITVAFLGYKWLVFRTRGNYLREWWRCVTVYAGSIAIGLAMLPPTVWLLEWMGVRSDLAPYGAAALVMGVQVIANFFGHKRFAFASSSGSPPADPAPADERPSA